ncbi:MAG: hypothetical protein JJT78_05575 [Leptospira sp.]|nr:hypothetical protein [Leptospira sp.]
MNQKNYLLLAIFQFLSILFYILMLGMQVGWDSVAFQSILPWAALIGQSVIAYAIFIAINRNIISRLDKDDGTNGLAGFRKRFWFSIGIFFLLISSAFTGLLLLHEYLSEFSDSLIQLLFLGWIGISIALFLSSIAYLLGWKEIILRVSSVSGLEPLKLRTQFAIIFGSSLYGLLTLIIIIFLSWSIQTQKTESNEELKNRALSYSQRLKTSLDRMENEASVLSIVYENLAVVPGNLSRDRSRKLLADYIQQSQFWEGVWINFEPNQFDGKDNFFKSRPEPMQDRSGRHMAYYTFLGEGNKKTLTENTLMSYEDPVEGSYYQQPFSSGKNSLVDPYPYTDEAGKQEIYVSQGAPIRRQGKIIGVVGIDLNLNSIQKDISRLVPKGYEFVILSQSGVLALSSGDKSIRGENIFKLESKSWKGISSIIEKDINDLTLTESPLSQERMFWTMVKIPIGSNLDGINYWLVLFGIPVETVTKGINNLYIFSFLVLLFASFMTIGLSFQLTKPISKSLNAFIDFFKKGTRGDIREIEGETSHFQSEEFMEIYKEFQIFLRKLREIVSTTQDTSSQINSNMQIFASTANDFAENAQNQASSIEEATAALEENSASLESIHQNTEEQANLAEATYRAMQQLETIIQAINTKAESALSISETATQSAASGSKLMQDTVLRMTAIRKSTEKISETIGIIQGISEQVNLLALNAAIEAARAGEHGKGFAVVAQEIGKLAEGTAKNSDEITKLVKSGLSEVASGQNFVNETSVALQSIIEIIDKSRILIQEISSQAESSRTTSNQVLQSSQKTREMSETVSVSTSELKSSNNELLKSIESINEGTQIVATGADDISLKVREILDETKKMDDKLDFFEIE